MTLFRDIVLNIRLYIVFWFPYGVIRGIGPHENVVNDLGSKISNTFLIFAIIIIFSGFFFKEIRMNKYHYNKYPFIIVIMLLLTIILTELFLIKPEYQLSFLIYFK